MDDATHTDVPIDVDPDSASRCHLYTGAFVDVIEGTREGIFKCGSCRVRNKVVVGKMEALYVVTRGDGCVGIFKNYVSISSFSFFFFFRFGFGFPFLLAMLLCFWFVLSDHPPLSNPHVGRRRESCQEDPLQKGVPYQGRRGTSHGRPRRRGNPEEAFWYPVVAFTISPHLLGVSIAAVCNHVRCLLPSIPAVPYVYHYLCQCHELCVAISFALVEVHMCGQISEPFFVTINFRSSRTMCTLRIHGPVIGPAITTSIAEGVGSTSMDGKCIWQMYGRTKLWKTCILLAILSSSPALRDMALS